MTTPHDPDIAHHKTGYWWFVMAVTGGLSLTFNLWMVIDPPKTVSAGEAVTNLALGVIVHASPVALSALVSHGFNTPLLGKTERHIIIGIFLTFMLMSISHQATLLETFMEEAWAWLMPLAIDTIAMLALRAILTAHRLNKEAAERADIEADMAALAARLRPDIEADIRAQYEADMPRVRADIEADIRPALEAEIRADMEADMRADMPRLKADMEADIRADMRADIEADIRRTWEADMTAARADIEADIRPRIEAHIRAELEAEMAEKEAAMSDRMEAAETEMDARLEAAEAEIRLRVEVETEARIRRELAGSGKAPTARKGADSHARTGHENGMTSKDRARILIDGNPEITGGELGTALGLNPRSGRRLLDEIRAEQTGQATGEVDEAGYGHPGVEPTTTRDVRLRAVN